MNATKISRGLWLREDGKLIVGFEGKDKKQVGVVIPDVRTAESFITAGGTQENWDRLAFEFLKIRVQDAGRVVSHDDGSAEDIQDAADGRMESLKTGKRERAGVPAVPRSILTKAIAVLTERAQAGDATDALAFMQMDPQSRAAARFAVEKAGLQAECDAEVAKLKAAKEAKAAEAEKAEAAA